MALTKNIIHSPVKRIKKNTVLQNNQDEQIPPELYGTDPELRYEAFLLTDENATLKNYAEGLT